MMQVDETIQVAKNYEFECKTGTVFPRRPVKRPSRLKPARKPVDNKLPEREILTCLSTYSRILKKKILCGAFDVTSVIDEVLTDQFHGRVSSIAFKTQMRKISEFFFRSGLPVIEEFAPLKLDDETEFDQLYRLARTNGCLTVGVHPFSRTSP